MLSISTVCGPITFRPLSLDTDIPRVHSWLTSPHAHFWGCQQCTVQEVHEEYRRIATSSDESAWILEHAGHPCALVEVYRPATTALGDIAQLRADSADIGLHILVSPPQDSPIPRFTSSVFSATVRWIFSTFAPARIVVEPDAANDKIIAKNMAAGFGDVPGCERTPLTMGGLSKQARIQTCTHSDFLNSALGSYSYAPPIERSTVSAAAHLHGPSMELAQRQLLAKAIREYVHERLLPAEALPAGSSHSHRCFWGSVEVRFDATEFALEHLSVAVETLHRPDGGDLSLPELIVEAAEDLCIDSDVLPTYLEEIEATIAARARKLTAPAPSTRELSGRDLPHSLTPEQQGEHLQRVEAAMSEGHPCFIANSGRGGMSEQDLTQWSPEAGQATPLVWLAAARRCCVTAGIASQAQNSADITSEQWRDVLGEELWARFHSAVRAAGEDPESYVPLPVHPWQWSNRFTTSFASDLASGRLIFVGESTDLYRPQQSLRTFFNISRPHTPYVKTAVAVRNMGFLRGLSSTYMETTPAINQWLSDLLSTEPEFAENNVVLLKESMTVGYTGSVYHRAQAVPGKQNSDHVKMSAALFRDSPIPFLTSDERAVTLASMLHRDSQGRSLVAEWIEESGGDGRTWLRRLLDVYLLPTIHALAAHGIVFMPHGENVILRLRHGLPSGAFFKDLGEEVAVVDRTQPVPEAFDRIVADHGEFDGPQRALSIHTDVVDGVLRHLAVLMHEGALLPQEQFWATVRECILTYEEAHPGTMDKLPLLSATFKHSCLNRLQLRNPLTMVDLGDQNASLIYAGSMPNPLASQQPLTAQPTGAAR
ncbi:Aerobactin synthase [Corynebacterium urogenitale]|uniref:Lysine N-acyltransferase MbtK n=1 Tax=Corynebacterium urogenitale TaxID=2487892 RepID=A0A5J6ZC45_9CORY|nr:GNAT family N-acetyltransferase [Corynebacterium urogenitale]QFQ03107.1 Aerobactin synthase [Corynebacterium urogenitale]